MSKDTPAPKTPASKPAVIPTPCPIFYEALAGAAKCAPADAYEHYHSTVHANPRGRAHPVESFLEDYAVTPK